MFPRYLEYEDNAIVIKLQLDSYKTFILGKSGSGKTFITTQLYKMKKYASLRKDVKLNVNWDNLFICLNSEDVKNLYTVTNSIIILDRLDLYMNEKLAEFIRNSNNIFILITRYGIEGVNTTHENFKVLKFSKLNNKILIKTVYAFSSEGIDL